MTVKSLMCYFNRKLNFFQFRSIIFFLSVSSIFALSVLFISCKKILTPELKTRIENSKAINSVKDLEAVLMGAYDGMQSENVFGGNQLVCAELLADDTQVFTDKLSISGTYDVFKNSVNDQAYLCYEMWRDAYKAVNCANIVIDAIDNLEFIGEEFKMKKNKLKGEALFIRAVVHFSLLQFWSLPYDVNHQGANSQLGIPYRTHPIVSGNENMAIARNSVEDVYNNVISDLKNAELLLSAFSTDNVRSRSSKYACAAFLARIYFQKGDYANALTNAQKITLKNQTTGLDGYGLVAIDPSITFRMSGNAFSCEGILQLVNNANDDITVFEENFVTTDGSVPLLKGALNLRNIYNISDSRRYKYVAIYSNAVFAKKYAVSKPTFNKALIRSAEMYLIEAESYAMLQGDVSAFNSYKTLKQKRFGVNWIDEPFISHSNLIDSIRVERRREMIFEGDRYNTIRRLQQNLRNNISCNNPSVLFKIPLDEMNKNLLMIQN